MKIAIPVKLDRENPPVAPLFGKAKWFAFIDNGKVEIKANTAQGGKAVIKWFSDEHVDTIIMQEMGQGPYSEIKGLGTMTLYHSGFERILLEDVLKKYDEGTLSVLDDSGMSNVIAHHEIRHPAHNEHGHQHQH